MRSLPLALALLAACRVAALAGEAVLPIPGDPPFEVVFENGVDIARASSPDRALGNVKYCWNPDGVVSRDGDACGDEHLAVIVDLDLAFSFEGRFGDFYQKGREIEAVVFHELLHGWACTHREELKEYERGVSDGRRTRFESKKNRVIKPLWAIERRMEAARARIEMGDSTRKEYVARGGDEFGQALLLERWQRYHAMMPLDYAREALDGELRGGSRAVGRAIIINCRAALW